ncbi:hypothetical protein [Clostridium sp.]|uniref:hypothetical protein n=1 Tax=Clostridium sp. TaxID=1506 RepID=UPI0026193FC2|nr:hypothetical protein [Clostridium sp.]
MKFKFEKNLKIINELMTYLHKLGSNDIHVNMCIEEDSTIFILWGKTPDLNEENLNILVNALNIQRQHEIEEYYWNLLGEYETDNQLSIIGMMIDKAEVTFNDNILNIKLQRMD